MGLRCSVLGHDYGDSFVERDREERGDEVVVTERELEECTRCGAEKVTAENTEVRALQPDRDSESEASTAASSGSTGAAATAESSSNTTASGTGPTGASRESATTDASTTTESGGAFTSASDAIERAEPESGTDAVAADPDGEDAVILDDDTDDEPGSTQWDEPAEPEADPEPESVDGDAEVVDASATGGQQAPPQQERQQGQAAQPGQAAQSGPQGGEGAPADAAETDPNRGRGEWPEQTDADDEGVDAVPNADAAESTLEFDEGEAVVEADTGFTSAGPLDNAERTEADDQDYALYCPECGFERYAGGSSLRAGDICPECRRGYIAEDR